MDGEEGTCATEHVLLCINTVYIKQGLMLQYLLWYHVNLYQNKKKYFTKKQLPVQFHSFPAQFLLTLCLVLSTLALIPDTFSSLPPPPVSTVFVLSCVFPRRPLYGDVLVSSLHAGGEAFFSCLTGYQLQGPRVLTCRNASTPYWSGKEPHCLGEYWLQFTRPFWLLFSKNCIIIIWQIFWNYYYIIVVIIVVIIHIIRTEVVYTENNMN